VAHHAFISHSTKDKTSADAVCARLEADGVRCWISPRDIYAGDDWNSAITEAISASRVMVLVWSSNSNASPDVILEVKHAFRQGIPVIPFRIEDVPPPKSLEYYLTFVQWLDAFTPPPEKHLRHLSEHVRSVLQGTAGTDAKEAEAPLSSAGRPRRVRHWWLLPVIITAGLLTLVPAMVWRREKAGMSHQPSATPIPADNPYEYPVVAGKWIYQGLDWGGEKVLKKPLVDRLKYEDAVREFLKGEFMKHRKTDETEALRAAQWHAIHTYAEIQDNRQSCSSCHKSFAPDVDRDTPRTTCAKCHITN